MAEINRKQSFAEIVRYGIAGMTTTLVNIIFYHCLLLLGMDYKAANLIAIICSKVYGYIVNKLFVFKSHCDTRKELFHEIGKFIGARGITGVVDYVGLIFMVEIFNFDRVISKYIVTAIVIILNYVFGKFMVFNKCQIGNETTMQVKYNKGNIEKYESKNPLKRAMVERLNNRILEIIGNEIMDGNLVRILDAGCGEGFIDHLLIDRFKSNVQITGLEFTADAIAIAKEANPFVKYVQGDICEMPFANNSFDYVICTEVLEHLSDPGKALKELMRVSTGRLLITVPHEPWFCLGNMIVLKNVKRLGNPIDHINHWTKTSFSKFLTVDNRRGWRIGGSFPWIIAQYAVGTKIQYKSINSIDGSLYDL